MKFTSCGVINCNQPPKHIAVHKVGLDRNLEENIDYAANAYCDDHITDVKVDLNVVHIEPLNPLLPDYSKRLEEVCEAIDAGATP